MDGSPAPRCRSVWADLDALVLEEVDALRAGPDRPPEAPGFASEEAFVAAVRAYLRTHHDPEALVERLRADPGPPAPPPAASPDAGQAPAAAAPDGEEGPPPAESGGEAGT